MFLGGVLSLSGLKNEIASALVDPRHLLRKVVHVDMDAFFASVEEREDPTLKGRPLVIGGAPDSRGVVCTANYEARKFGIRSAMPCFQAFKRCPEAVFVKPRHDLYSAVSKEVFKVMRSFTDSVEGLSLDEAYLDVTRVSIGSSATAIAEEIRKGIYRETSLTASAGVAPNKMLAKIASDIQKPNGLTVVKPHQVQDFIARLPLKKINGVGPAMVKRLEERGFTTCSELQSQSLAALRGWLGEKTSIWLYNRCRGVDEREVVSERERKSIGCERTFSRDIQDKSDIEGFLGHLAEELIRRCNKNESFGISITLKVKFNDFTSITRTLSVAVPIADTDTVKALSQKLLNRCQLRRPIRLLGLSVSKLQGDSLRDRKLAPGFVQPALFS